MPKASHGKEPLNKAETKKVRETDDVVESHRSSADKAAEKRTAAPGGKGDATDPRDTGK
jgi:hypothetical protein